LNKLIKEFKAFALKGSVIDLAVGVIIGAAFSKITSSLVTDIATPIIGMFLGGVDLSLWKIKLPQFFGQNAENYLNIGLFLNTIIDFLILSIVVFIFIKAINKARRKKEEAPVAPLELSKEELLLTEIRDILKDK
jgi:large conductance mechanosensitive channel